MPPTRQSSLVRTSSATSTSSSDSGVGVSDVGAALSVRRTRKRFTNLQLMLLEQLFHKTSHPTRLEREDLAREANMEAKSVTIWFQNKRQTERKVALHTNNATSASGRTRTTPMTTTPSIHYTQHPFHHQNQVSHQHHHRTTSGSSTTRPSLDRVASRSERMAPCRSVTPPPGVSGPRALWDTLPSSPLAPPTSPPAREREYVDFGRGSARRNRSLEWACAAARVERIEREGLDLGEETEDEDEEAITPSSSLSLVGTGDKWDHRKGFADGKIPQDDDLMRAALLLCGLGRRR